MAVERNNVQNRRKKVDRRFHMGQEEERPNGEKAV